MVGPRILPAVFAVGSVLSAQPEPPRGLLRQIAANGSRFQQEFQNYTHTQRFSFSEMGRRGMPVGFYREVREIFSLRKESGVNVSSDVLSKT